jgi:hypothetical protein
LCRAVYRPPPPKVAPSGIRYQLFVLADKLTAFAKGFDLFANRFNR